MRYTVRITDADDSGQLASTVVLEMPFTFNSGTLDDGDHDWHIGGLNEILSILSGQSFCSDGYSSASGGFDIKLYIKYKGSWTFGFKFLAFFGATTLSNSSGQGMVHKYWHKKGLSDGLSTNWRSVNWAMID